MPNFSSACQYDPGCMQDAQERSGPALEFVSRIGEGSYGSVLLCRERCHNNDTISEQRLVAVKRFKWAHTDELGLKIAVREVRLLRSLDHPLVIRLERAFTSHSGRLYAIFPFIEGGCGQRVLKSCYPHGLPPLFLKSFAWQLCVVVRYLHHQAVVHRDIKPSNVLLSTDGTIRLCDFGFARRISPSSSHGATNDPRDAPGHQSLTPYVQTRPYRAPEVLLGLPYDTSADVWSVGATIAEMATGQPLLPGSSSLDQLWRILGAVPGPRPAALTSALALLSRLDPAALGEDVPEELLRPKQLPGPPLRERLAHLDPRLVDFIEACMRLDPGSRPTADELLCMPLFDGVEYLLVGNETLEGLWRQTASAGAVARSRRAAHGGGDDSLHASVQTSQSTARGASPSATATSAACGSSSTTAHLAPAWTAAGKPLEPRAPVAAGAFAQPVGKVNEPARTGSVPAIIDASRNGNGSANHSNNKNKNNNTNGHSDRGDGTGLSATATFSSSAPDEESLYEMGATPRGLPAATAAAAPAGATAKPTKAGHNAASQQAVVSQVMALKKRRPRPPPPPRPHARAAAAGGDSPDTLSGMCLLEDSSPPPRRHSVQGLLVATGRGGASARRGSGGGAAASARQSDLRRMASYGVMDPDEARMLAATSRLPQSAARWPASRRNLGGLGARGKDPSAGAARMGPGPVRCRGRGASAAPRLSMPPALEGSPRRAYLRSVSATELGYRLPAAPVGAASPKQPSSAASSPDAAAAAAAVAAAEAAAQIAAHFGGGAVSYQHTPQPVGERAAFPVGGAAAAQAAGPARRPPSLAAVTAAPSAAPPRAAVPYDNVLPASYGRMYDNRVEDLLGPPEHHGEEEEEDDDDDAEAEAAGPFMKTRWDAVYAAAAAAVAARVAADGEDSDASSSSSGILGCNAASCDSEDEDEAAVAAAAGGRSVGFPAGPADDDDDDESGGDAWRASAAAAAPAAAVAARGGGSGGGGGGRTTMLGYVCLPKDAAGGSSPAARMVISTLAFLPWTPADASTIAAPAATTTTTAAAAAAASRPFMASVPPAAPAPGPIGREGVDLQALPSGRHTTEPELPHPQQQPSPALGAAAAEQTASPPFKRSSLSLPLASRTSGPATPSGRPPMPRQGSSLAATAAAAAAAAFAGAASPAAAAANANAPVATTSKGRLRASTSMYGSTGMLVALAEDCSDWMSGGNASEGACCYTPQCGGDGGSNPASCNPQYPQHYQQQSRGPLPPPTPGASGRRPAGLPLDTCTTFQDTEDLRLVVRGWMATADDYTATWGSSGRPTASTLNTGGGGGAAGGKGVGKALSGRGSLLTASEVDVPTSSAWIGRGKQAMAGGESKAGETRGAAFAFVGCGLGAALGRSLKSGVARLLLPGAGRRGGATRE